MKKKNILKVLLVLLFAVIAGVIFTYVSKKNDVEQSSDLLVAEEESSEIASEIEEETTHSICVHICGYVVNPGVYYLPENSRIHEAVLSAGGFREEADKEYINLAAFIKDGEQIYFPSEEEVNTGNVPDASAQYAKENSSDDGLININTASVNDLKTLPGIGDIKAEAIISYRESVGTFNSIEEIKNVAGIKDSAFEKIKDYIKV